MEGKETGRETGGEHPPAGTGGARRRLAAARGEGLGFLSERVGEREGERGKGDAKFYSWVTGETRRRGRLHLSGPGPSPGRRP